MKSNKAFKIVILVFIGLLIIGTIIYASTRNTEQQRNQRLFIGGV